MSEQPLGSDTIWTGKLSPLAGLAMILAVLGFGLATGPRSPRTSLATLETSDVIVLLGALILTLCAVAYRWWHWQDQVVFEADGLTSVSGHRRHTIAWSEIDDLRFPWWTGRLSIIQIAAGLRRIAFPLSGLADVPGSAERLALRLEPARQAKLARLAAGEVRLYGRWVGGAGVLLIGLLLGAILFAVWSMMSGSMVAFGSLQLVGVLLVVARLILTELWRSAGPRMLILGWSEVPLARIETIRIVKVDSRERWQLRGPGVRADLSGGVDFPLLCEHLIRHCRAARYTYDVRAPRGPLEAAFLPLPPGATPELMVAPDEQSAAGAARRWRARNLLAVGAGVALLTALFMNLDYLEDNRRNQYAREHAVAVVARVQRDAVGWLASYSVAGQMQTVHIFSPDHASHAWRDGDQVTVYYVASPRDVYTREELYVPTTPATRIAAVWLLGFSLALLAWWLHDRQRQDRQPQPMAVGF